MAFPSGATDGTEHDEDGIVFLKQNGKWTRIDDPTPDVDTHIFRAKDVYGWFNIHQLPVALERFRINISMGRLDNDGTVRLYAKNASGADMEFHGKVSQAMLSSRWGTGGNEWQTADEWENLLQFSHNGIPLNAHKSGYKFKAGKPAFIEVELLKVSATETYFVFNMNYMADDGTPVTNNGSAILQYGIGEFRQFGLYFEGGNHVDVCNLFVQVW